MVEIKAEDSKGINTIIMEEVIKAILHEGIEAIINNNSNIKMIMDSNRVITINNSNRIEVIGEEIGTNNITIMTISHINKVEDMVGISHSNRDMKDRDTTSNNNIGISIRTDSRDIIEGSIMISLAISSKDSNIQINNKTSSLITTATSNNKSTRMSFSRNSYNKKIMVINSISNNKIKAIQESKDHMTTIVVSNKDKEEDGIIIDRVGEIGMIEVEEGFKIGGQDNLLGIIITGEGLGIISIMISGTISHRKKISPHQNQFQ